MIPRASLVRIDRQAENGRTRPLLGVVETDSGDEVEVFVKLSAGCDERVNNLAREAITACLAFDLGLPVPRPWLVDIPAEIAPLVPSSEIRTRLQTSVPIAFGSTRAQGFATWKLGDVLTPAMQEVAAGVLLFDAIIQNSDRGADNPNCLVCGDALRIIDHEMAFTHRLVLGWKSPWLLGGMNYIATPGCHIFFDKFRGSGIDLASASSRWSDLSDERLQEYCEAIPEEWSAAHDVVDDALKLIADARDNIDKCVAELKRLLK